MLKTYRTGNPTMIFSKYEFNNKLLSGVILFRVISNVTWIQFVCIYNDRQIVKEEGVGFPTTNMRYYK